MVIKFTACESRNLRYKRFICRRILKIQINLSALLYSSLNTLCWPPDDLWSDEYFDWDSHMWDLVIVLWRAGMQAYNEDHEPFQIVIRLEELSHIRNLLF